MAAALEAVVLVPDFLDGDYAKPEYFGELPYVFSTAVPFGFLMRGDGFNWDIMQSGETGHQGRVYGQGQGLSDLRRHALCRGRGWEDEIPHRDELGKRRFVLGRKGRCLVVWRGYRLQGHCAGASWVSFPARLCFYV